eukprot:CAMPEP_0115061858 /NCGR_PEP_ID=MMETSP0227-20121206/8234_1 /TAXON_ID=89957 /ORGANISM="Polarella glacialis, Strain CCMP 1383" /LENGTH=218 /DNA_ID=CAMNT_0002447193 /DNA_START=192 /DNA_END=844 /DNA_ORIENTATION=+
MICGDAVPSWVASIPGPKYDYKTDVYKTKPPVWSMRIKPEMVVGSGVPSWIKSIPGPKYVYDTDMYKSRQPVYSIKGRGEEGEAKAALKRSSSAPVIGPNEMKQGMDATTAKPPSWSVRSRPKMISGDAVPSWVNSIPGPKYVYPVEVYKQRTPVYSIGVKLPTESDLKKARSPGPNAYSGAAVDAKKQEQVDSTRTKSFSCGFGIGSRWEGPTAGMA